MADRKGVGTFAFFAAAIRFNATTRSLLGVTFPHPTLSEAIFEAAASIV